MSKQYSCNTMEDYHRAMQMSRGQGDVFLLSEKLARELSKEHEEPKFAIEVYQDHAIIKGWIDTKLFRLILALCQKEGFTHLANYEGGFKLVRKDAD